MAKLLGTTWELGADRHGRRVVMIEKERGDITIEIEPSSQRDEGERIHYLNAALIIDAATPLSGRKV